MAAGSVKGGKALNPERAQHPLTDELRVRPLVIRLALTRWWNVGEDFRVEDAHVAARGSVRRDRFFDLMCQRA